jgi:hypothetical protein
MQDDNLAGLHGVMLGMNHDWRAIPFSSSLAFKTAAAGRIAVLATFVASP